MITTGLSIDENPWSEAIFAWKDQESWLPSLSEWLRPCLRSGAQKRLARRPSEDLYLDDPAWVDRVAAEFDGDFDLLVEDLADDLMAARLVSFHACRVLDAGAIHAGGLKLNDPDILADEARRIVAEEKGLAWLRPDIEARLASFDDRDRDTGRLYVVADDRLLTEDSGHYLLYGSEWLQVLLGWGAHDTLRQRGVPTIIELHLPLSAAHSSARARFAQHMLREWSRRQSVRVGSSPRLDFSFSLHRAVPPAWVVTHKHPAKIRDPFYRMTVRQNPYLDCPHCRKTVVFG